MLFEKSISGDWSRVKASSQVDVTGFFLARKLKMKKVKPLWQKSKIWKPQLGTTQGSTVATTTTTSTRQRDFQSRFSASPLPVFSWRASVSRDFRCEIAIHAATANKKGQAAKQRELNISYTGELTFQPSIEAKIESISVDNHRLASAWPLSLASGILKRKRRRRRSRGGIIFKLGVQAYRVNWISFCCRFLEANPLEFGL